MDDNYSFFLSVNLDKYLGQWIAIVDRKIVSNGKSFKEVLKQARTKCPNKKPFVTRVPTEEAMIF